MPTGQKTYPYTLFRFKIEINGIIVAQVSEVSGLQVETETETYEEGGENGFVYQLPKRTKFQHITLKRGITDLEEMWKWHQEVVKGKFQRKNGAIILMDVAGEEKWRWNFFQAFPVKWTGPDFKADSNTVAFETIELAHHGIEKG
ncbi:MAG TPA: phage tail protein [Thermodesulfobacteriota bacterium]|nr:phage tail protein [Thermodesulfobacteriota bacterium]